MLLYRLTKMMEEHTRIKNSLPDGVDGTDENWAELRQIREQMEGEMVGPLEEDCTDWAAHVTY